MYIVYTLNGTSSRVHDDLTPFEIYTSINPLYLIFVYLGAQSLCTYLISYARIWMQKVVQTYSLVTLMRVRITEFGILPRNKWLLLGI